MEVSAMPYECMYTAFLLCLAVLLDWFVGRQYIGGCSSNKANGGRGLLSPKSKILHGCAAEPQKYDFLYTNFSPNYPLPPSVCPFRQKST